MKKRPKGTTSNYNDNKVEYQYIVPLKIQCVGGIMVSIAAFQAVDPGSIPGRRNFYVFNKEVYGYARGRGPHCMRRGGRVVKALDC